MHLAFRKAPWLVFLGLGAASLSIASGSKENETPWNNFDLQCSDFAIEKMAWFQKGGRAWFTESNSHEARLRELERECVRKADMLNGDAGREFSDRFSEAGRKSASLSASAREMDLHVDAEVLRLTGLLAPLELSFIRMECGKSMLEIKEVQYQRLFALEAATRKAIERCPALEDLEPTRIKTQTFGQGSPKIKNSDIKHERKPATITGLEEDRKKRQMITP